MSSTSDSATIAAYRGALVDNNCIFAALTFVAYEHIITFQYEHEFVWRREWTAATWLFIANRYLLLASVIAQAAPSSYRVTRSMFIDVLFALPVIVLAASDEAFSALRVFALLDRSYIVAGCVFLLAVTPVGITIYEDSHMTRYFVDDPVLGASCYVNSSLSPTLAFKLKSLKAVLSGLLTTVAADLVAIVTTWVKTYRHIRHAASVGVAVGFSATLIKYGTLYFIVLLLVYLLDLLVFLIPAAQTINVVGVFVNILPNVVLSRFLINLREVDSAENSTAPHFSLFSVLHFRVRTLPDVIGNLGEPLADDDEIFYDEEPYDPGLREDCLDDIVDPGASEGSSDTPQSHMFLIEEIGSSSLPRNSELFTQELLIIDDISLFGGQRMRERTKRMGWQFSCCIYTPASKLYGVAVEAQERSDELPRASRSHWFHFASDVFGDYQPNCVPHVQQFAYRSRARKPGTPSPLISRVDAGARGVLVSQNSEAGQKYTPKEFRRYWIAWMMTSEYEANMRRGAITEQDGRKFLKDLDWWLAKDI
ncbi:hypothetical protein NM688_g3768 [Phlebia brevispora]|uniref:Uncharacterized protein n=1 Tax=Phlebia brevispora TaxID=194682 RepID=A0ACC1T4X9_9APHY|nr:hypothetical protein NM688_g3768 [Phlebia brevispora]